MSQITQCYIINLHVPCSVKCFLNRTIMSLLTLTYTEKRIFELHSAQMSAVIAVEQPENLSADTSPSRCNLLSF